MSSITTCVHGTRRGCETCRMLRSMVLETEWLIEQFDILTDGPAEKDEDIVAASRAKCRKARALLDK